MVMLTEQYAYVIGGDPDRDTIDLAVLDTGAGQVRAHLADSAVGPGYARMLAWADAHAPPRAGVGAGGDREARRRAGPRPRRGRRGRRGGRREQADPRRQERPDR